MAKRTKAERQKSARKAARTRAKNEACKTAGKKPKAAKKGAKKAAKKPKGKRSAKQKANDKRLGKMAKARAKKGGAKKPKGAKKGSKPKKPKGAKKGGAKKSAKRASGGIVNGEARLSHVEKVQLADHKTLTKHSRQLSTIAGTERKMKQILGAKGLSSKAALPPKVKASIGKQIKLETKKAVAKIKDATEAANAAKYG